MKKGKKNLRERRDVSLVTHIQGREDSLLSRAEKQIAENHADDRRISGVIDLVAADGRSTKNVIKDFTTR